MATADELAALADKPAFVFPFYVLILAPLALYVYHDILDTRWRPVWRLVRYLIAYFLLYICSGTGLIGYVVIQMYGKDYKEVGASVLALILGTYGAWKLLRLARIIRAHYEIVTILQRVDKSLADLTGLRPVTLKYHLFRKPKRLKTQNKSLRRRNEARHDYISTSLFDDDYPGDSAARIKWLSMFSKKIEVLQEDADECASRVGLWMRLVVRNPRSEPWLLLVSSSPLIWRKEPHASLGAALRDLITFGSATPPPPHVNNNPAELLLNGDKQPDLIAVGVGFFWIASEMGAEEMSQVLAEMPPRWMRGVTQQGKQLIFESVMALILTEIPYIQQKHLRDVLFLPVLKWRRDVASMKLWHDVSKICADAMATATPKYTLLEMPSPEEVHDEVRKGVYALQDATSDEYDFQGDLIGLSLIELIRAAYSAGFLTEMILGEDLSHELKTMDFSGSKFQGCLYKAEIVMGLLSMLIHLGQHDNDAFRTSFDKLKEMWGVPKNTKDVYEAMTRRILKEVSDSYNLDEIPASRQWFLSERKSRCENPAGAFSTIALIASEVAPLVLCMLKEYMQGGTKIVIANDNGDPRGYREQWLSWKHTQALEISGSVHTLRKGLEKQSSRVGNTPLPKSSDGVRIDVLNEHVHLWNTQMLMEVRVPIVKSTSMHQT